MQTSAKMTTKSVDLEENIGVAIIGMSGRFPGSANVDEFWRSLQDGVDGITDFSDEELLAAGVDPALLKNPYYVKSGAVLDDITGFDAAFFGLTPREAQVLDPQHRLFLETCWNAIEHGGYDPTTYDGQIGLFAGAAMSDYVLNNLYPNQELQETLGKGFTVLSNDKDSLATRVAYLMDLTGPCCSVQTYCSTSLVAVGLACESLVSGESDMAMAGGVALNVPQHVGYLYQDGGISSPDGRCRAFDAKAKGAPLGSGVAVVLLKRLEDAVADGDTIYAVIKGWAINNDGAMRTGFTAPGVRGQSRVILEALAHAEVEANSISYIEAHGTGTALGDAVEFAALVKAFNQYTDEKGFCAIGSVKTNIGHLDRAAGVTGLIKASLAMKHKLIPPTLHYEQPNPEIDFGPTPFYVNIKPKPWQSNGRPRRAGVSSFGMGGTNAHVIIEEAPEIVGDAAVRSHQLLLLSAKTETALDMATANLLDYLRQNDAVDLADVAYTLQNGRKVFAHRRALVCADPSEAIRLLESKDPTRVFSRAQVTQERPVAFMFPGVGDHYVQMAQGLYHSEPVFRQALDDCCRKLHPILGLDLRDLLYPEEAVETKKSVEVDLRQMLGRNGTTAVDGHLNQTQYAQPAVFAIEYALAQLLQSWEIKPDALIGYSLGEYVAACLAGVFSLDDALMLVARRAQMIQQLPTGSMLAVPMSAEQIRPYLQNDICLAVINGSNSCVLAGPTPALEALVQQLSEQAVACRLLDTGHAFHSTMMTPIAADLTALVTSMPRHAPQIPYLSNVTGTWITAAEATDPGYWVRHLCQTVRFDDGLAHLLADEHQILLEVGPGQSLSSFAKQHPDCTRSQIGHILPTMPHAYHGHAAEAFLLGTLGKLWLTGYAIDWSAFYGDERRRRIPLPTYPFEHQRYWIDPPQFPAFSPRKLVPSAIASASGKKADPADWFYEPVWVEMPLESGSETAVNGRWLIFEDELGWGAAMGDQLAAQSVNVTRVRRGYTFAEVADDLFELRPDETSDYDALCAALKNSGRLPQHVIHGWALDPADPALSPIETFDVAQKYGFSSVLYFTQALNHKNVMQSVRMTVLTANMQPVGDTAVAPEKATVAGLCRVISQEMQTIRCRSVDLALTDEVSDATVALLLAEVSAVTTDVAVAYRQGCRSVQQFISKRPSAKATQAVRSQGVYLITGGLGKIGLMLSDYLARTYQARLVLIGRSGLPAPEMWDSWLSEHGAADRTSRRIQQVRALEASGAEVLVLAADVADEAQMQAALVAAEARFGRLNGVIHAAGVVSRDAFAPVQETTHAISQTHFLPKNHGVYVLHKLLEGKEIDFVFLFSSLSAVLGGLGVAAYAASNNFLDAFAQARRQDGSTRWMSVNWDTWLINEQDMADLVGATVAEFAMTPAEGVAAFALAMIDGSTQLVHSTGDLDARFRQWVMMESTAVADSSHTNQARPTLSTTYVGAQNELEKKIGQVWEEVLGIEGIGIHDNFFDLGGNSLIGLQVVARIQQVVGRPVSAVALFEAPTISTLARYLQPDMGADAAEESATAVLAARRQQARQQVTSDGIAIVSMNGRFPGAASVEAFWQNLRESVETVTFYSEEELAAAGVPAELLADPNYVRARASVTGVELFDANFFGYSPREAEMLDPQHRLFLQCAWEALELAGTDPERYAGLIGVFAGANFSSYLLSWFSDPQLAQSISPFQAGISNDKDSLTTRVSYKLNLRGPSLAVQTFCSTSLVAVHLACQSLRNGECDMALAGGSSVTVPLTQGYLYQEGDQVSPDGHCRSFDAAAKGTVFGDGVGVVVLKRLADAIADGDPIQAVIRGSAINNDGSLKVGYTAPSVVGQSQAILSAWEQGGIEPESIGYIEAHGTATELGDPVEVASLTQAYRRHSDAVGRCVLGSVKSNIGHLNQAAGVSGLIKAALAVQKGEIPATLHYQQPNPALALESSPFVIHNELTSWPRENGRPRRAGVNSLGVGGTNAHVVVEEAPQRPESSSSRPYQLLLLSARTEDGLEQATANLETYLREQPTAMSLSELADVAYTLQVGRREFSHRRALLCRDVDDAIQGLSAQPPQQVFSHVQPDVNRGVAFLFPGVGDQYVQMGRELYEQEPHFQEIFEECCALLWPTLGVRLRDLLYPEETEKPTSNGHYQNGHRNGHSNGINLRALLGREEEAQTEAERQLQETAVAQPIVFVIEYALARLLQSWGIQPQALLGYSLGEYVAACLAGVLTLKDALKLVATRAQLIQALPEGGMVAVSLGVEAIQPWLNEAVSVAIDTGAGSCVLGGSEAAIAAVMAKLEQAEIACRQLPTRHAFHTTALAPVQRELTELVQTMRLRPPQIPYLSNVTGTWVTTEQATDPGYWAEQMCQPVRFNAALGELLQTEGQLLLEVGPGQALGSFAKAHPACQREQMGLIQATMPYRQQGQPALAFLLQTVAKLWLLGLRPDWDGFYTYEMRHKRPLPTYPFENRPFWLVGKPQPMATVAIANPQTEGESLADKINQFPRQDVSDWFYLPGWKQMVPPDAQTAVFEPDQKACWLLFTDKLGVANEVSAWLRAQNQSVVMVQPGDAFCMIAADQFTIQPRSRPDYTRLIQEVRRQGMTPAKVVHLWTMTGAEEAQSIDALPQMMDLGFYSLMYLTQALGEIDLPSCDISIITNQVQAVHSHERPFPPKATLIGPTRVIPQEYDNINCRCIDVVLPPVASWQFDALIGNLQGVLTAKISDRVIALREQQCWVQSFEPVHLPRTAKSVMRPHGVYLITGGIGGIGLGVARHLAQNHQARLVLTSRSSLPPSATWDHFLATEGDTALGQKISQVRELEALGAEVLVVAADVADAGQMTAVIQQATVRFGAIHGVFHAAGVPGMGLIQLKTADQVEQVLASKIAGTIVLEQVLQDVELDFLVLFSSITSVTGGGPGQIDYCAANAFLDAYAQTQVGAKRITVAVDWGEWQWNAWEAGLEGFGEKAKTFFKENRQRFGITFSEGSDALERLLSRRLAQIIVSTQDFCQFTELSQHFTISRLLNWERGTGDEAQTKHPRPILGTSFSAPRDPLEYEIASIWSDLLGIDEIGIDDNFFELGGNSLIGLDLVRHLQKATDRSDIPARIIYEAPSVATLATFLKEDSNNGEVIDRRLSRGEKRRQQSQRRQQTARGRRIGQ